MFLAFDLGTTSFKAALFDKAFNRLASASREICYQTRDIKVELAADTAIRAIRELIAKIAPPENLKAVAFTSQAQTFTVLDNSGQPLTPFISWLDMRAAKLCETMKLEPEFADYVEHSSTGALYPGQKLCLVKSIEKDIPREARIVPLPSFFIRELTGKFVTDRNIAAMSGFYSLKHGNWWQEAMEYCGLSEQQFPELLALGESAGLTAAQNGYGLPPGIPVFPAGNDQTAVAYSADVHTHNGILIGLGTAQIAYLSSPELPPPSEKFFRGPYPGGKFYRMAVDGYGGNLISIFLQSEPELAGFPEFFKAAAAAPVAPGLKIMLDKTRNAISWQGSGTAVQRARKVLEYSCSRLAKLIKELAPDLKERELLVSGGGAKNAIWRELLSEAVEAPLTYTESDSLLGAAKIAALR